MKKSSYIIFGLIGFLMIAAFFSPLILFTKEKPGNKIFLSAIGVKDSINFERKFKNLEIKYEYSDIHNEFYTDDFTFDIIESDKTGKPKLITDRSWTGNYSISYTTDSCLITFHGEDALKNRPDASGLIVPQENAKLGVIIVPRGMLSSVEASILHLTFKDFVDSNLVLIGSPSPNFINCSFNDLKLKGY